jgi:hypothetical protein
LIVRLEEETICEGLNHLERLIVQAILQGIAEPGSLEVLLKSSPEA